jgi:hypothetical protein
MGFSRGLRRGWLKSFERRAGELDSFRLKDGSLYFYNFDEAGAELFTYCVRAFALEEEDIPEPAILQKIRQAKDPHRALERFRPSNPERAFVDIAALLNEPSEAEDAS